MQHMSIGDPRERIYAPSKILAAVDALAVAGFNAEVVLAGTGLHVSDIRNPATTTSIEQFLTVCANARRLSEDPTMALRIGNRLHASSYGLYGYALLCCSSLRQAHETATRYHRLATPVVRFCCSEDAENASWSFSRYFTSGLPQLTPQLYRFVLDMQFAIHATLVKDVMGAWCKPTRALFSATSLPYAEQYAEQLGCPVIFGQSQDALQYPIAVLSQAPQLANSMTADQISQACAQLIAQAEQTTGLSGRVYQELMRCPGCFPGIEAVAAAMHMTSRTLRRKLVAEGASYSDILSKVRHALAVDYFRTTAMSASDIASALGFSDVDCLRHAFKRWTGMTPSEFRSNTKKA